MKPDEAARLLARAGARARTRPEFLGWVLARYEDLEALPEERNREQLAVSLEDWPRLQLCLRPRAEQFMADVTQIARAFAIDRKALAAIVRHVDAVEAVRAREEAGQPGSLMAARTRQPPPPETKESPDE